MKAWRVRGKDSSGFLDRVTAGRVRRIEPGQGTRGLLLNGQSRMISQFDLVRTAPEEFLLVELAPGAADLGEGLERLHFAEDLEIAPAAEEYRFAPDAGAVASPVFAVTGAAWPAVVPGFRVEKGAGGLPADFHFHRIGALVPWPMLDWSGDTPALEAAVLPWIDRDKGCYPGQEVVERSLNVGHPARVLQAFRGAAEPAARLAFAEGGEAVVTSSTEWAGEWRFLARVPWARRASLPVGYELLKGWDFSR